MVLKHSPSGNFWFSTSTQCQRGKNKSNGLKETVVAAHQSCNFEFNVFQLERLFTSGKRSRKLLIFPGHPRSWQHNLKKTEQLGFIRCEKASSVSKKKMATWQRVFKTSGTMSDGQMRPRWSCLGVMPRTVFGEKQTRLFSRNTSYQLSSSDGWC